MIRKFLSVFRRRTRATPAKVDMGYGPYFLELPERPSPYTRDQYRQAREQLEKVYGPDSIMPDLWLDRAGW